MRTIIRTKIFQPAESAVAECHAVLRVAAEPEDGDAGFEVQLRTLAGALRDLQAAGRVMFCRFFLSDAANQSAMLEETAGILGLEAVSVVQQPPLDGTKIAAWAYSIRGTLHPAFRPVWTGGLTAAGGTTPHAQMLEIFHRYEALLGRPEYGLSPAADCIRTWIFVQNVDVSYGGVVTGRKAYFDAVGLTSRTHYIASTGIEGRHANPGVCVQMDALAVGGLRPGQVRHLQAPTHLNPTYEYGVTFERGTAVQYGDRRHVFISGTANINNRGRVMYAGDVLRQTRRMLENIQALLAEAGAGLKDVVQGIVYLRDPADAATVRRFFETFHPDLNVLFVLAPVCRPAWLIEMECIAVTPDGDTAFPNM